MKLIPRSMISNSIHNAPKKNKSREHNRIKSKKSVSKTQKFRMVGQRESQPNIYSKPSIKKSSKSITKSISYTNKKHFILNKKEKAF
jgi:hypothetical protein